jgi:ubiquinone/menaquinone biosynthesis C-methylase UbiE
MQNPWLDISLADYEAHMALPTVGQSRLIADQLAAVVKRYRPGSVAIIGCAGGNGFDRMIGTNISRMVGVDINADYIEQARRRYEGRVAGLELHVADIQTCAFLFDPVDLLYAALLFEYVDIAESMSALGRHCKPNGILAVLSQLPHETLAHVSPSPYRSLERLAPHIRLVSQEELHQHAERAGFFPEDTGTILSAGSKHFSFQTFRLRADG